MPKKYFSFPKDEKPKRAKKKGQAKRNVEILARSAHELECAALRCWKYDDKQERELKSLIGYDTPPELVASNKAVRVELAHKFIDMMNARFDKHSESRFYLITLLHENWHTFDRKCKIDIEDMRRRIAQCMKLIGVTDYIGMIEIDAVNNYPKGDRGRWIMPHAHLIARVGAKFQPKVMQEKLRGSKRLAHSWDVKTAKIDRIKDREDMLNVSPYLPKVTPYCKKRDKWRQKYRLSSVTMRPDLAIRLAEIQSHLTLNDILIAGGTEKKVKTRLMRHMRAWLNGQPHVNATPSREFFWRRLRRQSKKDRYKPVRVKR